MADQTAALAYLGRDPLRHITMLKLLHAYGPALDCHYVERGGESGVLLAYPPAVFPYDAATYPLAGRVLVLASDGPSVAEALLDLAPPGVPLVLKVINPADRAALTRRLAPRLVNVFASYTSPPGSTWPPVDGVAVSGELDERCLAIFAAKGHDSAEVRARFAAGQATSFTIYAGGEPTALCYIYQNYGPIWEVAGVYTDPGARRAGLGRRVVGAALHTLAARGLTPRYQVHAANLPSVALAEALGLTRFVTIEHFAHGVVAS